MPESNVALTLEHHGTVSKIMVDGQEATRVESAVITADYRNLTKVQLTMIPETVKIHGPAQCEATFRCPCCHEAIEHTCAENRR